MPENEISREKLIEVASRLWEYCAKNDFSGYDPYDALNSSLVKHTPLGKSKFFRLALTQVLKRVPVNLRPILFIPKTQNPKALAIFLKAALRFSAARIIETQEQINYFINRISELRSPGMLYYCWGYSFPWQTRGVLVPSGSPNLVCTVFVADALLDAYRFSGNKHCLEMACSAADYILDELYWSENENAGFSYPQPDLKIHIYNADLLGAAFLAKIAKLTNNLKYIEPALKVARCAVSRQNKDGSWYYGELPESRWIDNFHTGYNLVALKDISCYAETEEFNSALARGLAFYKNHFFRPDGAPKYYHNKVYPVDIHCLAQSIITLEAVKGYDKANHRLALSILNWALENMWSNGGYFYYRVHRFHKNRISYLRWSQAWMALALSLLLSKEEDQVRNG